MNEQKIMEALTVIGQKLGVASEHLYSVLVRQAYVDAAQFAVEFAVACIPAFILCRVAYCSYPKRSSETYHDYDNRIFRAIACTIAGSLATIVAAAFLCRALGGLINPEYLAIKEILGAIK